MALAPPPVAPPPDHRDVDARLYARWVAANGWSEAIGLGGTAVVAGGLALVAPEPASVVLTLLGAGAVVAAGASLEGVLVGYAQARVLSRPLPRLRRRRWIAATALGAGIAWALGMIPSTLMALLGGPEASGGEPPPLFEGASQYVLAAAMGLVLGPILGTPQWWVLRQHVPRAGWWVPANAAAWAVGMPIVFLGAGTAFEAGSMLTTVVLAAGALVLTGLAVGAVHGAVLVALLRGDRGDKPDGP